MPDVEIGATIIVILSIVSFIAGFVDSVAGGGGLLLVPSLLISGLPPQIALGTNKFAATLGTSTSLANFIRNKKIVWTIAMRGVLFALLGAFLGTKSILLLNNELIGKVIVFLLPIAIFITLLPKKNGSSKTNFSRLDLNLKVPVICFLIGFYDGFFGPGAGSFFIISFHFLIGLGLVESSATSKVFNFISNLGALITFIFAGKVIYLLGLPLAGANILGNFIGSHLVIKKGASIVRFILIVSLSILFISLVLKYFL